MNEFIYWLDQISASDRLFVGDKAFNLSQLHQQGFRVVPGFIISSRAFVQFLKQIDDSESLLADFPDSSLYLNVDNPQALRLVAQQSRKAILNKNLSAQWLLSLVNAAGQLNSSSLILRASVTTFGETPSGATDLLLGQVCWNTAKDIELALKTLWGQLFSAKSLFYWQRLGIELERVNFAVLVQPITNAIASGIVHIEPDYFCVQASWGLGHSILQGEVLPDTYHIRSSTGIIETKELGNKTRAYRLKTPPSSTSDEPVNFESCLEAYMVSQEDQKNYCLNDFFLNQLTQILQSLSEEVIFLEWTLTDYLEPQFYLVKSRVNTPQIISNFVADFESIMTDSQPILTGLSASSGIIYAQAYVITDLQSSLEIIPEGQILIAKKIIHDWLPWLKKTVGIIVEEGGITSHAAIIARELRIPAIVGATRATELLKTGEFLQLDADRGEVYLEQNNLTEYPGTIKQKQSFILNYPIGTRLMVNLSQTSSITHAVSLPVDGVGLLRSELMLLELIAHQSLKDWLHPSQKSQLIQQWSKLINRFAREFAPRPVFYRSLDWIANQEDNSQIEKRIFNSLLGERGTYSYRVDDTLFNTELQVLEQVYQSGNTNVNLILPFVRSVEEFKFCRSRVEKTKLIEQKSFQLWIMAEVPSVIFLLSQYIEAGVQGIAIGTNDLTQLLLGVNREETKLSQEYNGTHPAMLAALKQLITQAKAGGIPCSICGQAPIQYPELIDHLIQWGITSISVEPESVEKVYQLIARAEQRLILEKSRII